MVVKERNTSYKAVSVISVLIIVWVVLLTKNLHAPVSLQKGPGSLQKYVNSTLVFRNSMTLNGTDILRWINGQPRGLYSTLNLHYTPLVEGRDTVNGAECLSIRFKPHLKLRPWIQLWIDDKTGFIHSVREWSAENQRKPVGIKLNTDQALGGYHLAPCNDPGIPHVLPEGYRLIGFLSENSGVKQYFFSDGLQALSILIGKTSVFPNLPKNVVELGNMRIASTQKDAHTIILLADLPADAVKQWVQQIIRQL